MASTSFRRLAEGEAAFYGVRPGWLHLWQQAVEERRRRYYLDNAWFDAARESHFRIGVNALQTWSTRPSDGRRLAALGLEVSDRTRAHPAARHVMVAAQSVEFMQCMGAWPTWERDVLARIRANTARPVILRRKGEREPFAQQLAQAACLVTHSSAAAVQAVIAGVRVVVTDPKSVAAEFASRFDEIDNPFAGHGGVREWASRLADSQWRLDEMAAGAAREWIEHAGIGLV